MALLKYDQTILKFLPYDIQRIIFNEYTELATRETFKHMIDDLPSQLSSTLQSSSLYEKLMQELYAKLETDVVRYTEPDIINSCINIKTYLIHDLIINYLNVMILIQILEPYNNNVADNHNNYVSHLPHYSRIYDLNFKTLITLRRTLKLSHPRHDLNPTQSNSSTNILRKLDYRQLLLFKNICNYNQIPVKYAMQHNANKSWIKNLDRVISRGSIPSRIIYDPVKYIVYYWIDGYGDLPYRTICNMNIEET